MKQIRLLLLLALLMTAATGAWAQGSGTKIYSVDFSDYTSYPFYNASESATVENGLLVLTNSKVYTEKYEVQPEIGRPTPITSGKCYRIAIQYKTTVGGPVNVVLGPQDWSTMMGAWWVPITVSDNFQTLEATFLKCSYGATDNHILFQFGDLVGTVYIKKVEVYEFDYVDVTGVTLSSSTASVNVGDKVALTATVAPDNATEKTVKWSVGGTNADAVKLYTDEACTKLVSGSPFTTNAQGLITTRLLPGTYWVKEVDESSKRPDWEFDTATRKLTVTAGNTSSVTFNNKHFGYAQIVKETSTGKDLAGWKFNIYADESCTTLIEGSPFTSGNDGTIKVKLAPGTYWVQEIDESDKNPDWTYDTTVRKVTVTAGDVAKVTFTNTHFGYAEIQKSTNTGKDLAGWKFNIYTDADCTQKVTGSPFTTDNAGKMSVRLLPGTYFVQEVDESAAKPDWVFDTKVHVVTVKAGETVSVTLKNEQMGRAKLIKAMPDGGPVSGWVFDIYRKSDNAHMGTFTSSEDGTILSGWMLPGEYLVYEQLDEQSIYWCESENPQSVTIKAGETAEVTFTNRLKPGKIAIQKVDVTGKPLAGAEFLLEWSVDGKTWQPVSHTDSQYVLEGTCTSAGLKNGRLISGADGLVEFNGLHPERLYRLTETAAPDGYQLLADTAYEGGLPADKDLVIQLTVVNVPTFELPKTGSKSMLLMPISLALAAALCGAILVIGKRKKL